MDTLVKKLKYTAHCLQSWGAGLGLGRMFGSGDGGGGWVGPFLSNQLMKFAQMGGCDLPFSRECGGCLVPSSSVPGTVDHSMKAHATSSQGSGTQMPGGGNFSLGEESLSASSTNSGCPHPQPVETISPANTVGIAQRQHTPKSDQFPSTAATPDSGVCADSDALLVSSLDTQASGVGHTTKYEVEGQITAAEPVNDKVLSHEVTDSEISNLRISQEMVSTSKQGLMAAKSQILEPSNLAHKAVSHLQTSAAGHKVLRKVMQEDRYLHIEVKCANMNLPLHRSTAMCGGWDSDELD
ncbi:hypothetical protein Taro_021734 [Colocasia esculenta]|uniref:Uncharacterized protein n=1 Tax=Colocasia esculenta TaxID=4460 RepID=A0A843VCE6_COLES|nr:hypothetical protein [Colocasia esculenta]